MCFFASVLLVPLITGCQYDRSFLNMNSDSGAPFFGLQLSVDASDVQQHSPEDRIRLVSGESAESVPTMKTETTRAQSPAWESVAVPVLFSESTTFPDPQLTVAVTEHPFTTVGRRLAAF